jgi:hypothetical protein
LDGVTEPGMGNEWASAWEGDGAWIKVCQVTEIGHPLH